MTLVAFPNLNQSPPRRPFLRQVSDPGMGIRGADGKTAPGPHGSRRSSDMKESPVPKAHFMNSIKRGPGPHDVPETIRGEGLSLDYGAARCCAGGRSRDPRIPAESTPSPRRGGPDGAGMREFGWGAGACAGPPAESGRGFRRLRRVPRRSRGRWRAEVPARCRAGCRRRPVGGAGGSSGTRTRPCTRCIRQAKSRARSRVVAPFGNH